MPSISHISPIILADLIKFSAGRSLDSIPVIGTIIKGSIIGKNTSGNWQVKTEFGTVELPASLQLDTSEELQFRIESKNPSIRLSFILPSGILKTGLNIEPSVIFRSKDWMN